MFRKRKLSIYVLALFALQFSPEPVEATPVGAECWADGLCRFNGCTTPDPDCDVEPLPRLISLSVRRYTTSVLSNTDADTILADASQFLQTNNGSGDVACNVELQRSGSVSNFTTGDGSIDSSAEFNTVIGLSGYVKVVNQINWCGVIGFNFVGCAPNPGNSFTVVRFGTTRQEAIAWAHEYGHTEGLSHRSGDVVMNGTVSTTNIRVNQTECNAL